MTTQTAWLICSPGDPTDAQWRAAREMTNDGDAYCLTRWNERSRYVRCEITRTRGVTDVYTIAPDAHDVRYIETQS